MREESTYQALLDAYTQRGHEVLALEREVERLRRGIEAERLTKAEELLRDSCSDPLPLARWLAEDGINYCSSCSEQDGDGHAVGCWWVRRDEYCEKRRVEWQ